MTNSAFSLTRRRLLAGLGAVATTGPLAAARAQPRQPRSLALRAGPALLPLEPGQSGTEAWSLQTDGPADALRFNQGDEIDLTLHNDLPAPLVLNWHGFDGLPAIEPLTSRHPIPPGQIDRYSLALRQAGTFLCDARLLGDGLTQSSPARALIVHEQTAPEVDHDELILIEDWRLGASGPPIAP